MDRIGEGYEEEILRDGVEIEVSVRNLYRVLRRPFDEDIASSDLTVPQIGVMDELTKEDGLSLKELSGRVKLSHSTVSGILDRLERKGLVERRQDSEDRRFRRIFVSEEVREYVREMSPSRRSGPISTALKLASEDEREQIISGIRTLERLLEEVVSSKEDS